jgi:hypothetical protein
LRLRQFLQSVLRAFRVEILEGLLKGGEPFPELGGERPFQLVPNLGKLTLPGGVVHSRRFGATSQRLQGFFERLPLPDELLLGFGDRLGALRLLVRERLALLGG